MDGTAPPKGQAIGNIISIVGLVLLILAFGFVGALLWLLLQ
jgi:hypothetical protein